MYLYYYQSIETKILLLEFCQPVIGSDQIKLTILNILLFWLC